MSEFPIIEKLGGRDAVFEHLRARCGLRTVHALRMWRQRGQIPGAAMTVLLDLAEQSGVAVQAADFRVASQHKS